MLRLEPLQHLQLLLLVARWQAHLLLPLVVHHLLHHPPRLAVQVRQLAVVGHDLGHVDGGGGGDDVRPPLELVGLVEVDLDGFGPVWGGGERPRAVVDGDGVGECALDDGFLPLDARRDGRLLDVDDEVAALEIAGDGKGHVGVADGLRPLVGERALLGLFLGLGRGDFGGGLFWRTGGEVSLVMAWGGGKEETYLCQPSCRGSKRGARGGVEKAAWKLMEALARPKLPGSRGSFPSRGGAIFRELASQGPRILSAPLALWWYIPVESKTALFVSKAPSRY